MIIVEKEWDIRLQVWNYIFKGFNSPLMISFYDHKEWPIKNNYTNPIDLIIDFKPLPMKKYKEFFKLDDFAIKYLAIIGVI